MSGVLFSTSQMDHIPEEVARSAPMGNLPGLVDPELVEVSTVRCRWYFAVMSDPSIHRGLGGFP